ncbi:MAG: hypothetical protein HYY28_01950 [Betaproteobacteria bacterium]|nr:hypothetical protein [Betaproteobacteria bacterium]
MDTASEDACPACGLIFSKYMKTRFAAPDASRAAIDPLREEETTVLVRAGALLFQVPDEAEPIHVYARALLLAMIVFYGVKLAAMDIPSWQMSSSFIHAPMVPIHEFGHVLFRPFGEFMMLLGGSLFQAGLPLVLAGIFLLKNRDPFAASVMLWWSAVAVMDIAPYVYDAQQPQHILLTGRTGDTGAHDFIDVLGALGLLNRARAVGYGVHAFGVVMLAGSIAWGAALVWLQFRRRGGR